MPRFHLGSIDFAKDKAKLLRRTLRVEGRDIPLGTCQAALARLYGYADWSELVAVTRARKHPMTQPGEIDLDPSVLADVLGVDAVSAASCLSTIAPDSIRPAPVLEYEHIDDLTSLGRSIEYALGESVRHLDDRFMFGVDREARKDGYVFVPIETVLERNAEYRVGEPRTLPWDGMQGSVLLRETWISLVRHAAYRALFDRDAHAGGGYVPVGKEERVAAMTLPAVLPDRVVIKAVSCREEVRFLLERTPIGIEASVLDETATLATVGIENPEQIEELIYRGNVIVVLRDRHALLDALSRHDGGRRVTVLIDPTAEEVRATVSDADDATVAIGLPCDTFRDAYRMVHPCMRGRSDIGRGTSMVRVTEDADRPGRYRAEILEASLPRVWEPYHPPRSLLVASAGIASLPVSVEAADTLRRIAEERCTIMVEGSDPEPFLDAICRHRVDRSPDVAAATMHFGLLESGRYHGRPDREWTKSWIEGDLSVCRQGSRSHDASTACRYVVSRLVDDHPGSPEVLGRDLAVVEYARFGRLCPSCSTDIEASWVMDEDLDDLRSFVEPEIVSGARYRYPFGCRECRDSGYVGWICPVSAAVAGNAAFVAGIEDRDRRNGVSRFHGILSDVDDPIDMNGRPKVDAAFPLSLEFDAVEDARRAMMVGLLDPVEWMKSGACAGWNEITSERREIVFRERERSEKERRRSEAESIAEATRRLRRGKPAIVRGTYLDPLS